MGKIPTYFTKEDGVKKKSAKQESRVAKALGGKPQKASGALDFNKGDVKSVELLIECKFSDKKSISIKREWLEKISKEAIGYNKEPALSFEFGTMSSKAIDRDWVAVPARFLRYLIAFYRENCHD